ncbi:DNA-directed RNA polymerase subunit alpha [Nitrosophilus kaiyonis]|uniref:DNA-directed RNA polymerase subunit alpha n=1 Tax=Nitrosophilus kaiyonis TaxID=2930200 RepID=UPI002493442E|nr:DNA-directed RNA polymerase subunit alpha [Nitrosophilus kaiyonis]
MKKIKTSPYMPTEVEVFQTGKNSIRIEAYPYESGFAISVAHPLRRLLLSSSIGYAPVAIKIDGVAHEFDSVRGMLEDVAVFIINLKNIRFKIRDDSDKKEVSYEFNGPKEIYGKDLENEDIEIVTPDAFLATLNEDANLKFSLIIHKGIGYVPSEEIREGLPEGYLPLDAFFTPVKKAIYDIEKVLVEDNPNFEKIVFNIETDGQVDPLTAFKDALAVMYNQMSVFNNELNVQVSEENTNSKSSNEIKKFLDSIDTLNLSARSHNCLERAGIKYVGELVLMSEDELKNIKNLGKKSLDEIKEKLEELGYTAENLSEELLEKLKKKLENLKS